MFAYELEKATINANRQGISGWLAERGAGLQGVKVDDLLNDCAAQGEGCVFERNRILVTHLMAPLWVRCSLAGCITEVTDEALAMLDPKEPPPLSRVTTKAQRAGTAQPVKRANTTTAPVTTVPDKPPMGIQTPLTALQQNEARTAYFSGMMVMSGKRPAEAEKHFRRAADIDTRNVNYRVMLGNVLFEQQKWGEAAEAYRNAVQLEPDTGSHHANLATALLRAGKRDEAVTEAKEAMRCGIKEHSIYRELGLTPSP
jgi:tetratricopeptide (TPR) repeat protein